MGGWGWRRAGGVSVALAMFCAAIAGRAARSFPANASVDPASAANSGVTIPDGRPLSGQVRIEQPPHALPALHAEVPWSAPHTLYGWGSVRLFAHPRENELTVSAIVDAPSPSARWSNACEVRVSVDGAALPITASYIGAPMHGGVYDAFRMQLPIETVRAMARARDVQGTICGDTFAFDTAQRATLADFVRHFDLLARPDRVQRETPAPTGPSDPELPGEADEGTESQG
jgi:hypothetical protein